MIAIANFSVAFYLKTMLNASIGWDLDITNLTFWIPALTVVSSIIFTIYYVIWKRKGMINTSIFPIFNLIGIASLAFSVMYSVLITGFILLITWLVFIRTAKSNQIQINANIVS